MRLRTKLTLLLLSLSILPLALVGFLAYERGRLVIQQATVNRLVCTTILKESDFERWLTHKEEDLETLARQPFFLDEFAALVAAHDPADPEHEQAHQGIRQDYLLPPLQERGDFTELFILRPGDGMVLVSTDETREGTYKEDRPYFIHGQNGTYIQGAYYSISLGGIEIVIATPVRDREGNLVAVLAGWVDWAEVSQIMAQRSGLSATEDTYLVNKFNFLVTESRFELDSALKPAVRTEGVDLCLQHQDGVGLYDDYRGVPVVGAYRWMPERELCILTEVDQAEALGPIYALGNTGLGIGVAVALAAAGLGVFFAGTIVRPVRQLVRGAQDIGRGHLDRRVVIRGKDEIGQLGQAFNQMAADLLQSRERVAAMANSNARLYQEASRRNRELELLNRVIAASAGSLEPEEILEVACRQLALTFDLPQAAAALLNEEKTEAVVVAEYRTQGRPSGLRETIPVEGNPSFQYLLEHKAPLAVDDAQSDPRLAPVHGLMRQRGTLSLLILPLVIGEEVVGSLGLDATEPRRFSPEETDLAQRVVDQVSGALARIRLEEERRRLEEQYSQAQRMEAVGQLTAGIAHDFNNLLTAINGFAQLMQMRLDPDHACYDMAEKIFSSGQKAADLIAQLMAFSRKQVLDLKVLDLNQVVDQMHEMLRRIIREDIELETIPAADLWPVAVDPSKMEQVIVNLAVNAGDAMPHGGRLLIETANVVLDDSYVSRHPVVQPGDYVLLAVTDTGVGMSEEVQARVFEPFFTTKERGSGTGLGLAMVYGLVKQSGGYIWVYSEEGLGSSFKIYLPRAPGAAQALPPPEVGGEVLSGNETILLVEDAPDVRELAMLVLQEQGYTVLDAANGQEASQLAARHDGPIHLLLTDVVMPGMSGEALCGRLVQSRPDVQVLYMSGYTDDTIRHHDVLGRDVAFLQKPFTSTDLARKVRAVLDAP